MKIAQRMEHKGPFTGSGPNGGSKENCAVQSSASKWVDWTCARNNGKGGVYTFQSKFWPPKILREALKKSDFLEIIP